ncbi:hypothetical protein SLS57_010590 [Botryosphaeria dothidea]
MTDNKSLEVDGEIKNDVETASAELFIDPAAEKRLVRKLDMWLAPMMVFCQNSNPVDHQLTGTGSILPRVLPRPEQHWKRSHRRDERRPTPGRQQAERRGNRLLRYHQPHHPPRPALTKPAVTYIAFEIPASLVLKKLRPSRLIPFFIIGWSAVIIGAAFVHNYAALLATRLLLGAFESGLFPCLTLYLSTFYQRTEQARRISYLFVAAALSGSFGGLLAYGLTHLHGASGLAGWRWLFLVEGLISIVVGLLALFVLPDSFETAWWLREDEKQLMRVRHERAKVYHGSDAFDKGEIKLAFRDPKVWLSALCQFCANICSFGFSTFLPKIINGFGYSSVRTQLLTVPVYAWAAVIYVAVSFLSDHINRRAVFMVPMAMVTMTGYALLIGVSMTSTAVLYFATFVTATGIYCVVGLNVTWISNSNAGYFKRATAIGLQQTIGNSAGIVVCAAIRCLGQC